MFSVDTQKREIPSGGLSNSYGEPIPADSYGPPPDDGLHSLVPQPIPISDSYGPPSKPDLGKYNFISYMETLLSTY